MADVDANLPFPRCRSQGQSSDYQESEVKYSQEEAHKALLQGFGAVTGRSSSPRTGVGRVEPTTGFTALESDTSRSPGGERETYTDLDPDDNQPPDEVFAIYKQKLDELRAEISVLEDQLPKTGKQKLLKYDPFRFECTVYAEPSSIYFARFSEMDIIHIMRDLFNVSDEDNNYCCYRVKNLYTLWDKNISHLSIDLYAETEDLIRVLYVLDGICSKYKHDYKHQYRGETLDTDESFIRFMDSISMV